MSRLKLSQNLAQFGLKKLCQLEPNELSQKKFWLNLFELSQARKNSGSNQAGLELAQAGSSFTYFYKKIKKRMLITFLYIIFLKKTLNYLQVRAERCIPTKKNKKKNVNNVLVYILNKAPLPLLNYFQVRAKKYVPTKC
jgi:hypothetical protein